MASVNSKITKAIHCFREIYLEGIPLIIQDKSAFLSFVCILTGIEALSGYCYGKGKVRTRFCRFISSYFPPNYESIVEDLWVFRHKMVHAFSPSCFALTHFEPDTHFNKTSDGRVILNAENIFEDFRLAAEKYFNEVLSDHSRQQTMLQRLDDLQDGGSIQIL